jgi:LysM repeat protein
MQRDMKIGMALGVALVGIVGALFFRREPEAGHDKTPPPLPNVEQLDREIAEKDKTPYIQGLEEFDAPSAPVPPPSTTAKSNSGAKSDKLQETAAGKSAATPEPLRPTKSDTAGTDTAPAHNRDWEPTGPSAAPGKKAGESSRPSPAGSITGTGRTHVIKPGDTLSGLASRYLGSSGRYREIYEANRDQLRSADDVREGMTLKIPDGGKPREGQTVAETVDAGRSSTGQVGTKSQSGTKARPVSTRSVDMDDVDDEPPARNEPAAEAPREKLRFVPVPRGPFSAGRVPQ